MPRADRDPAPLETELQNYRGLGAALTEIVPVLLFQRGLSQTEQLIRAVQALCQIAMKWNLDVSPLLEEAHARALKLENQADHPEGVWLVWPHWEFAPPRHSTEANADEVANGSQAFDDAAAYFQRSHPSLPPPAVVYVQAPDGTRFACFADGRIQRRP